jgi:SSS family solute:Na+ symporter
MVSGMFVPVLAILIQDRPSARGALWAMIVGGLTTLSMIILDIGPFCGLDPNAFGISASFLSYFFIYKFETEWNMMR